ncbi:MAG: 16S rRNA (adenine(1518)-N(6)/adenine(1519)-N(6))-dimethyltransferase RsmA [Planctomycetota bacterium]|jgi:16S rRNA (adenine1518-N6/adenine1519-N6)-dimethyltransferase
MQTKQDIERLLAGAGTQPKHRLGQNFLIDLNLMRMLIQTAHLNEQDTVLEVGTGTGSFSQGLAVSCGRLITVEYDATLFAIAKMQLERFDNVTRFNRDILENKNTIQRDILDAAETSREELGGRFFLVANLPYNVGSSVMANLICGPVPADGMFVTIQKEVADRMAATPGGSDYGTLSILMAATGSVRFLRKLPASVFWPRPQVESAMVSFERDHKKVEQIHDMQTFREIICLFMGHRRKMLKACTKFAEGCLGKVRHWSDIFEEAVVDPHMRPEEISPKQYVNIANLCYEQTR